MITFSELFMICLALIGVIYGLFHTRVKSIEKDVKEHATDIQKLKDFNDLKIERIESDIAELRSDLKEIVIKIHKDSNVINRAINNMERVEKILKFHEDFEDKIEKIEKDVLGLKQLR